MEANFSKLFIAAGGGLLGAIAGGSFAGWRASAAMAAAGRAAEEGDAIAQASPHAFGASVALVIKGALIGGVLGILLTIAVLVLLSSERVRPERTFEDPEG